MAETIIERFFRVLSSQGIDSALNLVTTDTVFDAQGPASIPIYGVYKGHDGVRQFVSILQNEFDTEKFEVRKSIENAEVAFAFGYMQHRIIQTDRVFCSEFAVTKTKYAVFVGYVKTCLINISIILIIAIRKDILLEY